MKFIRIIADYVILFNVAKTDEIYRSTWFAYPAMQFL